MGKRILNFLGLKVEELCEGLYFFGLSNGYGCLWGKTLSGKRLYGIARPGYWSLRMNEMPNRDDFHALCDAVTHPVRLSFPVTEVDWKEIMEVGDHD